MNDWTAVVPIKPVGQRKSRLREEISEAAITILTEHMRRHVIAVLEAAPAIDRVLQLSHERGDVVPDGWFPDPGAGLNQALQAVARALPKRLLIVHADLPGLETADITALLEAASDGTAIACDRAGTGTNALGLQDAAGMIFAFGQDSFSQHLRALPAAKIVRRPGLSLDIDRPADIREAVRRGHLAACDFA